MKERFVALVHWLWRLLGTILRGLWAALGAAGRWLSRQWRLLGTRRSIRAKERERRERLEAMGAMVYILFKRSLVRNHDLLVECEKVRDIDLEIDGLVAQADSIRTERPPQTEARPRVAAMPLETTAAADAVTSLDPLPPEPVRLEEEPAGDAMNNA